MQLTEIIVLYSNLLDLGPVWQGFCTGFRSRLEPFSAKRNKIKRLTCLGQKAMLLLLASGMEPLKRC
jgi:hypothetical protein